MPDVFLLNAVNLQTEQGRAFHVDAAADCKDRSPMYVHSVHTKRFYVEYFQQ